MLTSDYILAWKRLSATSTGPPHSDNSGIYAFSPSPTGFSYFLTLVLRACPTPVNALMESFSLTVRTWKGHGHVHERTWLCLGLRQVTAKLGHRQFRLQVSTVVKGWGPRSGVMSIEGKLRAATLKYFLIQQSDRLGTSPVVQWLRICLPMPGPRVWFLVRELKSHMPRDI